jgi:hypothetical protein
MQVVAMRFFLRPERGKGAALPQSRLATAKTGVIQGKKSVWEKTARWRHIRRVSTGTTC